MQVVCWNGLWQVALHLEFFILSSWPQWLTYAVSDVHGKPWRRAKVVSGVHGRGPEGARIMKKARAAKPTQKPIQQKVASCRAPSLGVSCGGTLCATVQPCRAKVQLWYMPDVTCRIAHRPTFTRSRSAWRLSDAGGPALLGEAWWGKLVDFTAGGPQTLHPHPARRSESQPVGRLAAIAPAAFG